MVLTVSSSAAAGWVAPGCAELLVSSGPSGRAACWEPNESVHERRIELCGDGASWRPAGPVHFLKSNGSFCFFSVHIVTRLSSTSTAPVLPSPNRGVGVVRLDGYISTTVVSKWFHISFVQNHIRRPRPSPFWVSEVTMFPPSEIFDIMQDGRCNYNKDLWQRLSRPPTDASRSAWWHHHSSTKHHSNSYKGFQFECFGCTITSCWLCIITVISIYFVFIEHYTHAIK